MFGAWRSVVTEGCLERFTDPDIDSSVREALESPDISYPRVHWWPADDMDLAVVGLSVTVLSGIAERP